MVQERDSLLYGYGFTPSSLSYANLSANATNQNFMAQSSCEGELSAAQAQGTSLTAQLASANVTIESLEAQLEALQSGASEVTERLDSVEAHFRLVFKNPLFAIPGATPAERLGSVTLAILGMTRGEKNPIYRRLFQNP